MIVAFVKNPLQAGNDRDIIDYSNDIENRIENGFEELSAFDNFTSRCTVGQGVRNLRAVRSYKTIMISFTYDPFNLSSWETAVTIPNEYGISSSNVPCVVGRYNAPDIEKSIAALIINETNLIVRCLDSGASRIPISVTYVID